MQTEPESPMPFVRQKTLTEQAEEVEEELKAEGKCGKNCHWICTSIMASFGIGCGSYFYASRYAEYGLSAVAILGPGTTALFVSIKIARVLHHRITQGRWTLKENSAWWKKDTNSVRWNSLIPLIVTLVTSYSFTICMTYAWGFASLAGLNQGIISSVMNLLAIFNCIVFYFAFGEKVGWIHIVGVVLMIASIVCIGFAVNVEDEEEVDEDGDAAADEEDDEIDTGGRSKALNGLFAIVIGLGAPTSLTIQHYFIRKHSGCYTGQAQAFDVAPLLNIVFCFFMPQLMDQLDVTWEDIFVGGAAGSMMEGSRVLISYSIAVGLAGPVTAIVNANIAYQTILGVLLAGQSLDAYQVSGITLGFLGVCAISLFDNVVKKVKLTRRLSSLRS